MDNSMLLESLARDGAALRVAAQAAGLDASVPSCEGWTVRDLVRHVTDVHAFWAAIVEQGARARDEIVPPARSTADGDELLASFATGVDRLGALLAAADPETEVWTWAADHRVAFVVRRMAQETAVHCWDAELAAGDPRPIAGDIASEGIDEFLEHFLDDVADDARPVGGSVHIHCGDVPGEWTIRPARDGFDVTREHAKGDCALRGAASDLLLVLWRRLGVDAIDVVGDRDVASRFVASTNLS